MATRIEQDQSSPIKAALILFFVVTVILLLGYLALNETFRMIIQYVYLAFVLFLVGYIMRVLGSHSSQKSRASKEIHPNEETGEFPLVEISRNRLAGTVTYFNPNLVSYPVFSVTRGGKIIAQDEEGLALKDRLQRWAVYRFSRRGTGIPSAKAMTGFSGDDFGPDDLPKHGLPGDVTLIAAPGQSEVIDAVAEDL